MNASKLNGDQTMSYLEQKKNTNKRTNKKYGLV